MYLLYSGHSRLCFQVGGVPSVCYSPYFRLYFFTSVLVVFCSLVRAGHEDFTTLMEVI